MDMDLDIVDERKFAKSVTPLEATYAVGCVANARHLQWSRS